MSTKIAKQTDIADAGWVDDPKLLTATAKRMEQEHAGRNKENRDYWRLYYQKPVWQAAADPDQSRQTWRDDATPIYDILREHGGNLTAEVITAGMALLCRPLEAKVLPVGWDFEHWLACRQLGRAVTGILEQVGFGNIAKKVARDGTIGDLGAAKFYVDPATSEICCERLNPLYVFWPLDATDEPDEVVTVAPVPKKRLARMYPDFAAQILRMPTWRPRTVAGVDDYGRGKVDTVAVVEAWSKASGPGAPGRHVIAVGDVVLLEEDWLHDVLPVVTYAWEPNAQGWAGVPLTRKVGPYDLNNKRHTRRMLQALDGAVPHLLVDEDAEESESWSDLDFAKHRVPRGGLAPTVVVPQVISKEIVERVAANRSAAFGEAHINESASGGQAPTQLKSAVAQYAWIDTVQTVLLPQQEAWQDLWRDAAHIIVALAQSSQKARVRLGDILEEVKLPKLPRDKYKISFGLVSGLSLTVSGRLEQLKQIQEALPDKLDNADVMRHVGLPDTQALTDRLLAPRELAEMLVQKAIEEGDAEMPPAILGPDGLAALERIAAQEYCRWALRKRQIPPENLEALRRVWLMCKARIAPPTAPTPPAAALPPTMATTAPPAGGPAMPPA